MTDTPSESRASSTAFVTPEGGPSPAPIADGNLANLASHLDEEEQKKFARLDFLLKKSSLYSSILADRIAKQREEAAAASSVEVTEPKPKKRGKKRNRSGDGLIEPNAAKRAKVDEIFPQPPQIRATLKPYQLEGVQWMVSLWENGLNGILADEMGLGKTLQTITFLTHLIHHSVPGPFLIVCPLSVLHNWVDEWTKWAPTIPVCMYHGPPEERAKLRRNIFTGQSNKPAKSAAPRRTSKSTKAKRTAVSPDDEDETESISIIITTYEMIIRDRSFLSGFQWRYIVVDEGHRLKNMDSKLMKEIKQYSSANRLILTGTPLHNNLAELWSLLNFILPDIFDDLDSFQQWFNFVPAEVEAPTDGAGAKSALTTHVLTSLHAILKPFLLRRLKVDVEHSLPPKKEYVLYAPVTKAQKELYEAVLEGRIREWLVSRATGEAIADIVLNEEKVVVVAEEDEEEQSAAQRRPRRSTARVDYRVANDPGDDDEAYIDKLEAGLINQHRRGEKQNISDATDIGRDYHLKQAQKKVNNMRLQNVIMQLRKVCSHPFLFDWPTDPESGQPVVNTELVNASGKMLLLDRLLTELILRGHKVLIFSQFTTMLDIIQDWMHEYKHWTTCRIDGSTAPEERRRQMHEFNNGGDSPNACRLFLLSTRSGGLGINLVAADTVIFYDQDWNPQMDLQAQDRAHRIGQTRPVLIFRLVSNHTVETKIMARASDKRKLEALVIAKGKFKNAIGKQQSKQETVADMAASLLKLEGEKIDIVSAGDKVISDKDLDVLLDRSPEVFTDRGKGWGQTDGDAGAVRRDRPADGSKTAFEVFEQATDEANEGLARMMGEDD